MNKSVKKLAVFLRPFLNYLPFNNKIRLHHSNLSFGETFLLKTKIDCCGNNNNVSFGGGVLKHCHIHIRGNNNTVLIGKNCHLNNTEIWIEDDGNTVSIGDETSLCGKIHLACIEGTNIIIGKSCLFSSDIVFRTGDSHSVLNLEGERINPSLNIEVGDHVWIGHHVLVNKGVKIADNIIIGTGAVVTKSCAYSNVIIAGVPARVVKENVNWCIKRVSMVE